MTRDYSPLDKLCFSVDQAVRSLFGEVQTTGRTYPAEGLSEGSLSEKERKHVAGLMRVNHAGEICAQALYHGQGLVSRSPLVQEKMQNAALEEGDHLAWCQQRLDELTSHTSLLNPVWYSGSFLIGVVAGMVGDTWSLGFLAETERQVVKHLESHLDILPAKDTKTPVVLQQMQKDEAEHRDQAVNLGGKELPGIVKFCMGLTSKLMVKSAYWI